MEMRRIITGHDAQGRSRIVFDGPPVDAAPLFDFWTSPAGPMDSRSQDDQAQGPSRLCPPPGGSKFRFFTVAPVPEGMSREALEAAYAARFEDFGASACRVDTSRHPSMHKTESIDYIIVLKGEVTLLMDEGEVRLKPFDVVVQRGTNHGWVTDGPEPALLAAILIDAEVR
jgi:hypothetical protein